MPYTLRRTSAYRRGSCFSVKNADNGQTFSKCTTKTNAKKQIRLLQALHYNPAFKKRLRRTAKRARYLKKLGPPMTTRSRRL